MFDQPLSKRYVWGTFGWLVAFALATAAVEHYSEALPAGSPQRIALALAPLVLLVFVFRLDLTFYRELDEMQRLILLECTMLGAYAVLAACLASLLLEEFAGVRRLSVVWVIAAYGVGSLGGWLYVRRRYR